MLRFVPRRAVLAACLLTAALVAPAAAAAAAAAIPSRQGPEIKNFSLALPYSWLNPDLDPKGANDFSCRPTAAHPRPVILLHGTYANRFNSFAEMAPALRRSGSCVFATDFGHGKIHGLSGARALRASSKEVAAFVDRVLAATGAAQVDLVGYSQGGLVARAYLAYDGGADPADPARNKVASLVGLSAMNHGTSVNGLSDSLARYHLGPLISAVVGEAAVDVLEGSAFLTALQTTPEEVPGVRYTMVATKTDEINRPARDAWLTPGPQVTDIALQQGCPTDFSDHFNITYSPRAIALVERALDPSFRGRIPCQFLLPTL